MRKCYFVFDKGLIIHNFTMIFIFRSRPISRLEDGECCEEEEWEYYYEDEDTGEWEEWEEGKNIVSSSSTEK